MKSAALVQIRSKALELSESERAELAHDLVSSLDGSPDAGVAEAWDAEVLRRLQQIDDGAVGSIDPAELVRKMRQQFVPN